MYIIRADGNAKIGAGHLMRCLTVAESMGKMLCSRQNITFLCADEQSADMVASCGFQAKVLGTDYQDMESELPIWEELLQGESLLRSEKALEGGELPLGEELLEGGELLQRRELPQKEEPSKKEHVILVDSYYVTDEYLKRLAAYGRVYLMDDMQEHTYPVDAVINYNVFADADSYRQLYKGTETERFVGRDYVPVRQQFLNRDYKVSESVKNVLITTGGGDQDNIAGAVLKAIYSEDMEFHVVTGKYNPHLEILKEQEETCENVHIYHDVSDMAGLMQKCDIAVTAGGTTIYELAALGVPFLCFSYAKNQEALTEYIGVNGIAGFLGAYHRNAEAVLDNLQVLFEQYCAEYDLRRTCYDKERELIDGKGAVRLAEKLLR